MYFILRSRDSKRSHINKLINEIVLYIELQKKEQCTTIVDAKWGPVLNNGIGLFYAQNDKDVDLSKDIENIDLSKVFCIYFSLPTWRGGDRRSVFGGFASYKFMKTGTLSIFGYKDLLEEVSVLRVHTNDSILEFNERFSRGLLSSSYSSGEVIVDYVEKIGLNSFDTKI